MNFKNITLILSLAVLCSSFLPGCEEQTNSQGVSEDWFNQAGFQRLRSSPSRNAAPSSRSPETENPLKNNLKPQITFVQASHDFGMIKPNSINNVCEFVFKNTGTANLIISEVENSCSCTRSLLVDNKKEYAPGESGRILADYTDTQLGRIIKHIYVYSNDPANPKTELAVTAEIVAPIDYEPKKLDLKLFSENAGCPDIVVKSKDNKPFSIIDFKSTGDCIRVNFNPQEKATQFVLKPQVDMAKLGKRSEGSFTINLSHPDCAVISGTYNAPPRFAANPQMVSIAQADPKKSEIKTIYVISNYNEAFTVQASSNANIVSVLETRKISNGYQLTVEIKPPAPAKNAKMFSDKIKIALNGVPSFEIPCNGYYPDASQQSTKAEECKTCGPVRLDRPDLSKYPRPR